MLAEIKVEQVQVELVRRLRQKVLRPDYAPERSVYPSDSLPEAQHFAAWSKNKIVGVASIHPESLPGSLPEKFDDSEKVWRLRGMAVDPEFQGKCVGKAILRECINFIRQFDAQILWCNGRETAWQFYSSFGFEKSGEPFIIPESGEHFVMILRIKN